VLRTLLASGAGYASNIYPVRTYPDGLDVEAFTRHALNVAFRLARDDADREHVTPYIQRTNTKVCLAHPEDLSLVRWTLDAPEDLERLHVLWHRVMAGSPPPSPTFGWRATMRAHREVEREDSR
jgi:spore coat polysaccharide biosynthesis protein SpsF (cytidylyltransferase family)